MIYRRLFKRPLDLLLSCLALLLLSNTIYRAGFGSKLRTDLTVYLAAAEQVGTGAPGSGATPAAGIGALGETAYSCEVADPTENPVT